MRDLSIADISQISIAGSRSILDKWNLYWNHYLVNKVSRSKPWNPISFLNSSSVMVRFAGLVDLGLSSGQIGGGS